MVGACFITIFFAAGVHFVSALLRCIAGNPKRGWQGNAAGAVCEGTVMFGHYILMLLAMSFNIIIIICIGIGHGLGYLAYRYAYPSAKPALGISSYCCDTEGGAAFPSLAPGDGKPITGTEVETNGNESSGHEQA